MYRFQSKTMIYSGSKIKIFERCKAIIRNKVVDLNIISFLEAGYIVNLEE